MARTVKKSQKETKKPKAAPRTMARPKPGLGRGLGALIGAQQATAAATEKAAAAVAVTLPTTPPAANVLEVPVDEITRSPWQPRHSFEATSLQELSESIRAHGVIQPLLCRRLPKGYELIAGERRLRAATDAGLTTVPVIIMDAADREAAEVAIIENIQREDLNILEEAEGYRTLCETFDLTQQEVAERVGKGRATIANAMRLLELPDEVRQLITAGLLSAGHAKVLLSLDNEREQVLLARRCATEGETVRSLERLIQRRQAAARSTTTNRADIPDDHLRYLLERLHTRFQTQVRLQPTVTHANGRRSKGCLEIDFYDNDDLDRLLQMIGIELE